MSTEHSHSCSSWVCILTLPSPNLSQQFQPLVAGNMDVGRTDGALCQLLSHNFPWIMKPQDVRTSEVKYYMYMGMYTTCSPYMRDGQASNLKGRRPIGKHQNLKAQVRSTQFMLQPLGGDSLVHHSSPQETLGMDSAKGKVGQLSIYFNGKIRSRYAFLHLICVIAWLKIAFDRHCTYL